MVWDRVARSVDKIGDWVGGFWVYNVGSFRRDVGDIMRNNWLSIH